jgi:hypothetical protein
MAKLTREAMAPKKNLAREKKEKQLAADRQQRRIEEGIKLSAQKAEKKLMQQKQAAIKLHAQVTRVTTAQRAQRERADSAASSQEGKGEQISRESTLERARRIRREAAERQQKKIDEGKQRREQAGQSDSPNAKARATNNATAATRIQSHVRRVHTARRVKRARDRVRGGERIGEGGLEGADMPPGLMREYTERIRELEEKMQQEAEERAEQETEENERREAEEEVRREAGERLKREAALAQEQVQNSTA